MKLQDVQNILFDILCEVDDICKKNHIEYTLMGGTLLGAVRHQGFIPWDDDMDICICRKDLPRLQNALKNELPSHLKLIKPKDFKPNFYDFTIRVADLRYFWHKETEEDIFYNNLQNYICIDIFVLDYGSNSAKGIKLSAFWQKVLYGLAMGHRYRIKKEKYTLLQKIQTGVLGYIGSKISIERIIQWQETYSKRKIMKPTKYYMCTNNIPDYLDLPIEVSWFDEIIYLPFRNREFPAPKGYDERLTLTYGNYMEPPKDKSKYIQHFIEE